MGFFDFLFGSGPEVQRERAPVMTEQQQRLLSELVGSMFGRSGEIGAPFEGPLVAPLEETSQAIIGALGGRGQEIIQGGGQSPLVDPARAALGGLLGGGDREDFLSFLSGGQDPMSLERMSALFGGRGGGVNVQLPDFGGADIGQELLDTFRQGETKESLATFLQGLIPVGTGDEFENFFTTSIQEPAVQQFEEEILPRIGRSFGGANFFSSERQTADARAREDLLESLTRSRAQLTFEDLQAARDRALRIGELGIGGQGDERDRLLSALAENLRARSAAQQAAAQVQSAGLSASATRDSARIGAMSRLIENIQNQELDRRRLALGFEGDAESRILGALSELPGVEGVARQPFEDLFDILGATDIPRQVEDLGIERGLDLERFNRDQILNAIVAALGQRSFENIRTVTPGRSGILGDLISAGGEIGAAALLRGAPSDRKLKKNLHRIGQTILGIPLYLFQYLWSDKWHIGVVAQEALKVQPDAVIKHPLGFLMVDYSKLRIR